MQDADEKVVSFLDLRTNRTRFLQIHFPLSVID